MYALAFEPQQSALPSEVEPPTCAVWINDDSNLTHCTEPSYCLNEDSRSDSDSDSSLATSRNLKKMLVLSLTVVLITVSYSLGNVNVRRTLERELHQAEELRSVLMESQTRLLSEKAQLGRLSKVNDQLSEAVEQAKKDLDEKERALKEKEGQRTSREGEILQLFGQLQQKKTGSEHDEREEVAKFIKTMAYDRYGVDPQEVEFKVRFWQGGVPSDDSFVVQVVGFDYMPISSFLFLQQVEHGLWDRTAFMLNAPHVLLAEPVSGSHGASRLPEMEAMGLARMLMPEYHDKVPHVKYTIGFGAELEASGSYFLLNTMDNTDYQKGQPCFGRVVRGFDAVDKISAQETDAEHRIQPVEILSARLLRSSFDEKS